MHRFRRRRITLLMLILFILLFIPVAQPAAAQERQCFPQTGHCVEGRFLQYWRENGGLPVFGYPIGPARDERNRDTGAVYLTQWFERNRFEYHPENARPYDVLLGLLGKDRLLQQGRNWQSFPTAAQSAPHRFPETGHAIAHEPFWNYWSTHGLEFDGRQGVSFAESLALFGYPISEPEMEANTSGDRVLTQWFERARFEYHPNNPPAFQVLLGLLGNELQRSPVPAPAPAARPAIVYVSQGVVYRLDANGRSERVADLPALGKVLSVAQRGNEVVILREQGLQRVTASGARTIATFTKGNALFGTLLAPANTSEVFYSYARQPVNSNSPMFDGVAGVIEGNTARKLLDAQNAMQLVGLSADGRNLLVVPQGGDPGFGVVQVVRIASGEIVATLPITGYGGADLAPDRRWIATTELRTDGYHTIALYDLNNPHGAPRTMRVARDGHVVQGLIWGNDSRTLYATVYPIASMPTGELLRIDTTTRTSQVVARDLPTDTHPISISPDGRQMLALHAQDASVIDLQSGVRQHIALPEHALIAPWE